MDKAKLNPKAIRKSVQAGWGVLTNAYIQGFLPGGPPIYQGKLKNVCVPGMNCYSCPGALGACPIGAMQAVFDGRQRHFSFYVVGYLATIGLFVGRFICGWLFKWKFFLYNSIGTPTTYFVDSNGNIIGDPILGANVKKYEETMDKLLSEAK